LTRSEETLKIAVATIGPITVAIDARHPGYKFYSRGVYFDTKCDENDLNHCMLLLVVVELLFKTFLIL
jgi:hypothetical protein